MTEPRFGHDVPVTPPDTVRTEAEAPRPMLETALARIEANDPAPIYQQQYNASQALSWSHIDVAAGSYASVGNLVGVPTQAVQLGFPTLTGTATCRGREDPLQQRSRLFRRLRT